MRTREPRFQLAVSVRLTGAVDNRGRHGLSAADTFHFGCAKGGVGALRRGRVWSCHGSDSAAQACDLVGRKVVAFAGVPRF